MVSSSELDGFDISSQIDFIEEVLFIFLIKSYTFRKKKHPIFRVLNLKIYLVL